MESNASSTTTLFVHDGLTGRRAACKLSAYRAIRHGKNENNIDVNLSIGLDRNNGQSTIGLRDGGDVVSTCSEQSSDDLPTDFQSPLDNPIHAGEAREVTAAEEVYSTFNEINKVKAIFLFGCTIWRCVAWNRVTGRR